VEHEQLIQDLLELLDSALWHGDFGSSANLLDISRKEDVITIVTEEGIFEITVKKVK
jgi:hypothetical protein